MEVMRGAQWLRLWRRSRDRLEASVALWMSRRAKSAEHAHTHARTVNGRLPLDQAAAHSDCSHLQWTECRRVADDAAYRPEVFRHRRLDVRTFSL